MFQRYDVPFCMVQVMGISDVSEETAASSFIVKIVNVSNLSNPVLSVYC